MDEMTQTVELDERVTQTMIGSTTSLRMMARAYRAYAERITEEAALLERLVASLEDALAMEGIDPLVMPHAQERGTTMNWPKGTLHGVASALSDLEGWREVLGEDRPIPLPRVGWVDPELVLQACSIIEAAIEHPDTVALKAVE